MTSARTPAAVEISPAPRFTILLPVHRPPVMLPFAVESVLRQTEPSFELFIICDGAPEATVRAARAFEGRDARIRARPFPKGEARGEAHRAEVLKEARGRFLAQIADDDMWLDDHLAVSGALLETVDFANTQSVHVQVDGRLQAKRFWDIADPAVRARTLREHHVVNLPIATTYRRSAYDALPDGWTPVPPEIRYSDWHMWMKFFRLEQLTFRTRFRPTTLQLDQSRREDMTLEARAEEAARLAARLADPAEARAVKAEALRAGAHALGWREILHLARRDPSDAARIFALRLRYALLRRLGQARRPAV